MRFLYWWRHGRLPDLDRPRRFTEWTQWRKLNGGGRAEGLLTDKLHAKVHVAARTGRELAVPVLWSGTALPVDPPAPLPLMVKANHGCNQYAVVHSAADWDRVRRLAAGWLGRTYGQWLDEPAYQAARKLLLVEPFLGGAGAPLPVDYKVYVFGGRAAMIQIHEARATARRWTQFNRSWKRIGGAPSSARPPATLAAMLDAAEACAAGSDFLRVDFYEVEGRLWFGEYCLYPGSGLDPFEPDSLDFELGRLWAEARF
ncbi:MAG: ATP-grasp fold amidoligase family protein [Pseudomonadota bacterium]|nr:ATP-grasp fold amidoligase family protein [Pseudomonadota bacterium]